MFKDYFWIAYQFGIGFRWFVGVLPCIGAKLFGAACALILEFAATAPQPQYQPPVQQETQAPSKKNKHTRLLKREKSAEDPVFVGKIVDDAPNQNVKLAANNGFAPDLQNAINCSASIQVVSLAAPKWGKSDGVVNSSNLWLAKVFELAEKNNVGGDKINQILKTEMEKQTNENLDNLDALTNRAFECASNPPR